MWLNHTTRYLVIVSTTNAIKCYQMISYSATRLHGDPRSREIVKVVQQPRRLDRRLLPKVFQVILKAVKVLHRRVRVSGEGRELKRPPRALGIGPPHESTGFSLAKAGGLCVGYSSQAKPSSAYRVYTKQTPSGSWTARCRIIIPANTHKLTRHNRRIASIALDSEIILDGGGEGAVGWGNFDCTMTQPRPTLYKAQNRNMVLYQVFRVEVNKAGIRRPHSTRQCWDKMIFLNEILHARKTIIGYLNYHLLSFTHTPHTQTHARDANANSIKPRLDTKTDIFATSGSFLSPSLESQARKTPQRVEFPLQNTYRQLSP